MLMCFGIDLYPSVTIFQKLNYRGITEMTKFKDDEHEKWRLLVR